MQMILQKVIKKPKKITFVVKTNVVLFYNYIFIKIVIFIYFLLNINYL
jgi:hypothetical protein